jgi:AcrR family transcriptional regulator
MVAQQKTDRRVARTQKLLRDALHSLIHERDYDSIVVKEILDRANVGRSAFYTHFRDKDELLVSAFHDILGVVPSARPQPSDSARKNFFGLAFLSSSISISSATQVNSSSDRGDGPSYMDTSRRFLPD